MGLGPYRMAVATQTMAYCDALTEHVGSWSYRLRAPTLPLDLREKQNIEREIHEALETARTQINNIIITGLSRAKSEAVLSYPLQRGETRRDAGRPAHPGTGTGPSNPPPEIDFKALIAREVERQLTRDLGKLTGDNSPDPTEDNDSKL